MLGKPQVSETGLKDDQEGYLFGLSFRVHTVLLRANYRALCRSEEGLSFPFFSLSWDSTSGEWCRLGTDIYYPPIITNEIIWKGQHYSPEMFQGVYLVQPYWPRFCLYAFH